MAPRKTADVEADAAPTVGPDQKAVRREFTCPRCETTITAETDVAVCNGLNIRADERGNPILDDNGWVQVVDVETGERAQHPEYGYVLPGFGHAPLVMERGREVK